MEYSEFKRSLRAGMKFKNVPVKIIKRLRDYCDCKPTYDIELAKDVNINAAIVNYRVLPVTIDDVKNSYSRSGYWYVEVHDLFEFVNNQIIENYSWVYTVKYLDSKYHGKIANIISANKYPVSSDSNTYLLIESKSSVNNTTMVRVLGKHTLSVFRELEPKASYTKRKIIGVTNVPLRDEVIENLRNTLDAKDREINRLKSMLEEKTTSTNSANQCYFMTEAIQEAYVGIFNKHGGPFGCVIVKDGKIVGRGHNEVIKNNDCTCHGEVMAIRDACAKLGTFDLSGCELYTTAKPCPMCAGAIQWARIKDVYQGCNYSDTAEIGFDDQKFFKEPLKTKEVGRESCQQLFKVYSKLPHSKY